MSFCHTCSRNFGFFNKEFGCSKCHELNCKKCLLRGDDKGLICLKCSKKKIDQATKNDESSMTKFEDIEKLLLSNADDVQLIPAIEPSTSSYLPKKSNMDIKASNDIDVNIAKRLAALKGLSIESPSTVKKESKPDIRCDSQKVDDLIDEANNFVNIKVPSSSGQQIADEDGIKAIEKRLADLRGVSFKPNLPLEKDDIFYEEHETDQIILQCLDEVKLEDIAGKLELEDGSKSEKFGIKNSKSNESELKELPFCEICNEDADLRCMDCENLFCRRCYREFHDEDEYREHSTIPYQKIKSK